MPVDLASIESEEAEAGSRAQAVLADIQSLADHVKACQAEFEAGPTQVASARTDALEKVKEAKGEAKKLAQLATDVAQILERVAHRAELARSSRTPNAEEALAVNRYDQAHEVSSRLHKEANAVRDLVDSVYEGIVVMDRSELLESRRVAVHAARTRLEATARSGEKHVRPKDLPDRRTFTMPPPDEERLVIVRSKPNRPTYQATKPLTPAAGAPPIGVEMAGEAAMPIGWVIPGDSNRNWMWMQLVIINTEKQLVLPVRRCEVLELCEALGKMLGRSHEDFKLFVRQGAHMKRLLPTDQVPSRMYVKGITSWERERQKYKHPFAIIGAGHLGLRQALECLRQKVDDFVVFERLPKVGGEAWHRVANRESRLQTELGSYHLHFGSSWPLPSNMATWPSREQILSHLETATAEYGVLPHVQLKTNVTGMKIEKMSRLQMLEEGKGDSDPNAQHYKLTLQQQSDYDGQFSTYMAAKERQEKEAKANKKKKGKGEGKDDEAEDAEGAEGAEGADGEAAEKSSFNASSVMAFPGALAVPREEVFKGEELFGGPITYNTGNQFDSQDAKDKLVAIVGMGSVAVESVRTCLEHSAKSCYVICRRKNLVLPRATSWFINQSFYPPSAAEVLTATLPMYHVANDDPWGYYAVSADAALIQQNTRFPVSDFLFLAMYYGRAQIVVGEVKRLLHQMMVLESDKKLEVHCIIKALGFKGSFDVDSLMHASKMFGFWPDADFRRWVYCESIGVDFMNISTTSLSPTAMRLAEFPLHFLAFPKPDFKELVDGGNMHWNKADNENDQPAHVLSARDAMYVVSLVVTFAPALQELDYDAVKRKRQHGCHPLEAFVKEAAADWSSYCRVLGGSASGQPPDYPYGLEVMKELTSKNDKEGKKRLATALSGSTIDSADGGPTRAWNPHLKMYC